ncbi:hypothetical protein AO054_07035, partial [Haemophilus influenzae biotype aegyptius]
LCQVKINKGVNFSIKLNKKCHLVQIFSIYFLFIKSKRLLFAILSSQFENVYNCPRYSQKFLEK